MSKSPITCHVLDSTTGKPAKSVAVALEWLDGPNGLSKLADGQTDSDGRCSTLLPHTTKLTVGIYKMIFETGPYYEREGKPTFYPRVEIIFNYDNPTEHYHIPLLLSTHSYTTYRGS